MKQLCMCIHICVSVPTHVYLCRNAKEIFIQKILKIIIICIPEIRMGLFTSL